MDLPFLPTNEQCGEKEKTTILKQKEKEEAHESEASMK